MFDYKSIVTDTTIGMIFRTDPNDSSKKLAFDLNSGTEIGWIQTTGSTFEASDDSVFTSYKLWQTRPERKVGCKLDFEGKNLEELIEEYEELFVGIYILMNKLSLTDDSPKYYVNAIDWLRTTDFYIAPASTHYHGSTPGGLMIHSIKVYNQVVDLIKLPAFSDKVDAVEAYFAALVHDWCKIDYYEMYTRNVKDEKTGQWNKEPGYKVNQKGLPLGHGVTSMYLASRVARLSIEQALAIRFHMGAWSIAEVEKSELSKANEEHPMNYLLQFADQLACTKYAN